MDMNKNNNKNKEQLKECPRQSNKEILDSIEFSSLFSEMIKKKQENHRLIIH